MHCPVAEPQPGVEKREFDQDGAPDRLGSEAPDEAPRGQDGSAGRQNIVDNQDSCSVAEGIAVDLQRVGPVLEAVVLGLCRSGQFARLPNRNEPCAESLRDRSAEKESSTFDRGDVCRALRRKRTSPELAGTRAAEPVGS